MACRDHFRLAAGTDIGLSGGGFGGAKPRHHIPSKPRREAGRATGLFACRAFSARRASCQHGSLFVAELAVSEAVCRAFPLRDIVSYRACGLHRGLTELSVAGNFALHALPFGPEQVLQASELGN